MLYQVIISSFNNTDAQLNVFILYLYCFSERNYFVECVHTQKNISVKNKISGMGLVYWWISDFLIRHIHKCNCKLFNLCIVHVLISVFVFVTNIKIRFLQSNENKSISKLRANVLCLNKRAILPFPFLLVILV